MGKKEGNDRDNGSERRYASGYKMSMNETIDLDSREESEQAN